VLGGIVGLAGVLSVFSALTPNDRPRVELFQDAFTPELRHYAHGATALLGVALILLGRGLVHRRRLAYVGAVGILLATAITHVAKGLDVEEAAVMLGAAGLLVHSRSLFTEPTPRARWRSLLVWTPLVIGFDLAYGLTGIALRSGSMKPSPTLDLALREVCARLVGLTGPLHVEHGFGGWFPASITVLGVLSVGGLVLLALAPVAERISEHHHAVRDRVLPMVDRADGDTLDPFALRHDKAYVFSADGRAAVAYRYVNGVGLASADPVGEPDSFADAVARFVAHCEERGWRPASIGVRHDRLGPWEAAGLRSRYLGDEAIVDVAEFSLDGRAMRGVRQAANRTKKFGITTEIHREGDLDPTLRRALQGIAERHREGAAERGFSMALDGLLSGRDADCIVTIARDEGGTPIAFQRYVPCRAGNGLSLDAMRRDRVGPNGVNERMIVDTVLWAKEREIAQISLNFAVFKGLIEEGADLGLTSSIEAWVVRRINPYFQIESLYTFNDKFHPHWVPRFLVYRSTSELAAVGIAAASAEGFMPFDRHNNKLAPAGAGAR
jgi:lysyl-tRNA synthetase class 2